MTNKYSLRELTPAEMQCAPFGACPAIYEVERITPESEQCLGGLGCPEIYKVKRITPESEQCVVGACNEIYGTEEGDYLLIGTLIKPEEAGLEGKVGKNEALIKVPKGLIDNRGK
ncbi:hypothetical protein HY449_00470 [Candidatus Pacearchaeota archaeon]|nr:hypothetical protein [Candidatus Pacearchaeota archaeon]